MRPPLALVACLLAAAACSGPAPEFPVEEKGRFAKKVVTTVYTVAFSPDGKTLASGGMDKTIRLWDVATGKQTAMFTPGTHTVHSVAFSPDGKILATGNSDHSVTLFDLKAGSKKVLR